MPASHIEHSVTAQLALPVPPILRMALNALSPRRHVRPDLLFSQRRNSGSEPRHQKQPEPTNQRIECSAPRLPASGDR